MKIKISIFLLILFLISCSFYGKKEKLDPESEEFLSKTRYIITNKEKKEFLKLPPEKRKDYIQEFWARRPAGFKEEYFKRIDEANRLFKGAIPGWLQDRGMVYIIYGPPTQREMYPMGSPTYPYAHEIWYYEYIQIVFYDPYNTGDYRLTPESMFFLDTIRRIPTAQILDTGPIERSEEKLEFEVEMERKEEGINLRILIPYEKISLKKEGDRLETQIEVTLTISGAESINKSNTYKLSYSKEEIEKLEERYFKIEIPLKIKKGKYSGKITILNIFSRERNSKRIKFSI